MKRNVGCVPGLILLLALLCCVVFSAAAEGNGEAENLTGSCEFKSSSGAARLHRMTDGDYRSYWEIEKTKHPYVTIYSETPIYGLYLCFRTMPESYEIQTRDDTGDADNPWKTVAEGDTRYHHVFCSVDGLTSVRIFVPKDGKSTLGFNEVFVFGKGEPPAWVQRWEPTEEKADILFLAAHPDDELLFMGGAIATYTAELQKRVVVAYLCYSNTTRRSEALNGLWTMGVRHYPVFGGFRDVYSRTAEDAYELVRGRRKALEEWMTGLFRQVKPEVVVTHDMNGEYGHGQHKMAADCATHCYDLAADPEQYPESAAAWGTWQVKKLYLHLWGEESDQTNFNWEQPLASMGGKTATELAEEAYALHLTQQNAGFKMRGKRYIFSVRETGGELFPNTKFGLYRTEVGPDVKHDDFLENIPGQSGQE